MFFTRQKPKTEQEIIKEHTTYSLEKHITRNKLRLAQIQAIVDDISEAKDYENLSALMCEAMTLYAWLLDNEQGIHEALGCGLVLSSDWVLRKHKNMPLQFENNN